LCERWLRFAKPSRRGVAFGGIDLAGIDAEKSFGGMDLNRRDARIQDIATPWIMNVFTIAPQIVREGIRDGLKTQGVTTSWDRASRLFTRPTRKRFRGVDTRKTYNTECNAPPTRLREPQSPITFSLRPFPGGDIVAFDVDNLDQVVKRIAGEKTGTKW
jgi:hypothetical protein